MGHTLLWFTIKAILIIASPFQFNVFFPKCLRLFWSENICFFVFFYKSHTDVGKTTNVNCLDQFNTDFLPLFFFLTCCTCTNYEKKVAFCCGFFPIMYSVESTFAEFICTSQNMTQLLSNYKII